MLQFGRRILLGQDLLAPNCGTERIRLSQHVPICDDLVNDRVLTAWPADGLMLMLVFTSID